jgi:serine/threonine protein kinase
VGRGEAGRDQDHRAIRKGQQERSPASAVAAEVKYLHEQNVVHGDLKASNIILDAIERNDWFRCVQARVSDYGLIWNRLPRLARHSSVDDG